MHLIKMPNLYSSCLQLGDEFLFSLLVLFLVIFFFLSRAGAKKYGS